MAPNKRGLSKRGRIWHSYFVVAGHRHRQSLKTTDWREAQARHKELISQASQGKLSQQGASTTRLPFGTAADKYLESRRLELAPTSMAKEKQLLVQLRAFFKATPLQSISVTRIGEYRSWRAAQGVGPATQNAELGILRRILKRARLWARMADDIKPLKEPRTIGRALSRDEVRRLLETAASKPEWETAFYAAILALNTTARGVELKALRWRDVDLFDRILTFRKSKTQAGERTVPLTEHAIATLAKLRTRAEAFGPVETGHFVFAAFTPSFVFDGNKVNGYVLTEFDPTTAIKSWRTAWRSLTQAANFHGFRFHDLRHCAITELAESGASDATIMAIAGHVNRRMLERYSHVRMEAKRQAMKALGAGTGTMGYATKGATIAIDVVPLPV